MLGMTLVLSSALLGQSRYQESVQVTLVEVPVTVADGAGNPVRGLTKKDFELFDEGKRVEIEYFDVIDLGETRTATPDKPLPPAAYRNFLLLFDLANSSPASIGRARDAAREFVQGQLSDIDLAAVATYTLNDGVKLVTNFTRDRGLLLQGIESIGANAQFAVADPLMLKSIFDPSPMQGAAPSGRLGIRADSEKEQFETRQELNRMTQASNEKEQINRINDQLANFGVLALALDRLRGQKQVILLSEGFASHLLTGRQDLSFKQTQKENDAVSEGELWKVDSEKRFGSLSGTSDVTQMADLFRRADVRLHAIDIKGLRTDADVTRAEADVSEGLRAASSEGLSLVARPTGGTVFRNSNDMAANFARLLKQQEVIYLIGFRAPATKAGKFHKLRVKTTAKNAQLTHRSGYFEASGYANDMERLIGVAEVMTKDLQITDVPVSVLAAPIENAGENARVLVVMEVGGEKLLEGLTANRIALDLLVYAFDEKKQARDFLQQRLELDLTKMGETLRTRGLRYVGSMELPPGKYSVNAMARIAETGRTGSTHIDVTVPSIAPGMVLPPMAIADNRESVTILSPTRGREVVSVLSAGGLAFVPRARTTFIDGAEQRIVLMLHGVPIEDLAVTPALISSDGAVRNAAVSLVGRTEAEDDGGPARLLFAFTPQGLTKGDYRLQFTVTPKGGQTSVVTLPFSMQ